MTAVILAAGISSRLRPITDTLPKSLLVLGGKSILHRMLEALHHSGLQHCVIVTGYHRELIERSVHTMNMPLQIHFTFNPLFESTNNNYSLWAAQSNVVGQEMLLLDADILFDERILKRLLDSPHENALVIRRSTDLGCEEVKVELDPADRLVHIGKTVTREHATGESIGIEKFSRTATERLFGILDRRKNRNEFYEASFQELVDQGTEIFAVDTAGYPCIEIDTKEDLEKAEYLARSMIR